MAQIVRHNETISKWKLGVEYGLAVILERVEDVDALLALCRFVPTPQVPLSGVYDALRDRDVNLERWADHLRDFEDLDRAGERRGSDPWTAERFGDRRTATATLVDALTLARILWQESAREADSLSLVLVLADPRATGGKQLCRVRGEAVGMCFQYGSLSSALFRAWASIRRFSSA
jgi:hypothetical protein